jgi:hypothetical protein
MPTAGPAKKIYCNRCQGITRHISKGRYFRRWATPDDEIQGEIEYSLLICAGCEDGTLERTESDSENMYPDGTTEFRTKYFPERRTEGLAPKSFRKLAPNLEQIYGEAIACFNAGSLILATAGLRALLEGVCEDKKISGNNLSKKIGNLENILPNKNIISALHHFRFTGNDAVHKLKAPERETVKEAIAVMEDLLNFLYELEYKAIKLSKKGAVALDDL